MLRSLPENEQLSVVSSPPLCHNLEEVTNLCDRFEGGK
ncbi:hypothetical protein NBRC111894_1410 [Sporolactobacillus inulinus]|uniref:Uncharacterized protein n=1 Tax=Sporolactobacillus inulinus TaxID=2078 RepID=A0A4Y1ZA06_9BACL|nr:hypothetical protein NBRC111894_1410 [Sporolactobacillus inulinus]